LALKNDGSVVAWGLNSDGQCNVPSPNSGFSAVAGGYYHSLGLKQNGTVVAWGSNSTGQCNVPSPNANFVAIAAGKYHNLGLKGDGTVVAWGWNDDGQCDVPSPNGDFVAIAAGMKHSMGLKGNTSLVTWGSNDYGQRDIELPNEGFVAITASRYRSVAMRESPGTTGVEHPGPWDDPRAHVLNISAVTPNPFSASTTVWFNAQASVPATLEVHDVLGRLVRTSRLGYLGPGGHRAEWNGRDSQGNRVPAGIYFMHLQGPREASRAVKVAVVR
jgi:hypothetical protein